MSLIATTNGLCDLEPRGAAAQRTCELSREIDYRTWVVSASLKARILGTGGFFAIGLRGPTLEEVRM